MSDNDNDTTKISIRFGFWFGLWLFTIAFANLGAWQGVLAILLWPYYLGDAIAAAINR